MIVFLLNVGGVVRRHATEAGLCYCFPPYL